MFPSFTGSTRPRRQVNLSGRNPNPFVNITGTWSPSSAQTSQTTLAHAQQERILRQQERERPPAATQIQRIWRGFRIREELKTQWRREWDILETQKEGDQESSGNFQTLLWAISHPVPYGSSAACLNQLKLLVQFASLKDHNDTIRLQLFAARYLRSIPRLSSACPAHDWIYPLFRLASLIVNVLNRVKLVSLSREAFNDFLAVLSTLSAAIPRELSLISQPYYKALANVCSYRENQFSNQAFDLPQLETAILALIRPITPRTVAAYEGFVCELLTIPSLTAVGRILLHVANGIDYKILASATDGLLNRSESDPLEAKSNYEFLWLLAYFVYFHRIAHETMASDAQYVSVVSKLITRLAEDIKSRIDVSTGRQSIDDESTSSELFLPLPDFVRSEILTLVNPVSIGNLFCQFEADLPTLGDTSSTNTQVSAVASLALTLLRCFPSRADEIRMWLYLASIPRPSDERRDRRNKLPAIKYFFQAAQSTTVYRLISSAPREVVNVIQQRAKSTADSTDQQWQVILLFLELYTFVLKVMDDEEFLSGSSTTDETHSWTRQSALSLTQVQDLTDFLKNLAFALYWHGPDMTGAQLSENKNSLAEYFGGSSVNSSELQPEVPEPKAEGAIITSVVGITLGYLKGMVTGLLRMIYERDSRRNFLPPEYWLMTRWFEMDRFITAVVEEEEHKHQIQESYGADIEDDEDFTGEAAYNSANADNLVGTRRIQQVRNIERLKKQQRKASRRNYLRSVTPRLEILENMPFFIPFATRVQIFRQFVVVDQVRRRGSVDADEWRFREMNSSRGNINRYRAKVRRDSIFEDAYAQFYDLGEGLKEPIQISFVDKFDTVEEGIDGGGVTKEFLTSITKEAFASGDDLKLFVENDHHLLYPNPSIVDERKEFLRQAGIKEGSVDWNEAVRDLLRRFEFLGRIIGKCFYEGILVDVHFAGFFLLKWALTGGTGSAAKESSYRANLNDLRDLDESLYQGLLQLKNYPGNVEDFSLNFAVSDTISQYTSHGSEPVYKTITRELRPSGADISVTNENRLAYISYIARHRLQVQPHLQTSAFLRGLGAIISPSWLSMFNQNELQKLVGGDSSEIDIVDLRRNTLYAGIYAIGDDNKEHRCIQFFWQAMQSFSDSDRRKVLKFVTSTPRAPLLGFAQLKPRFSIRDSGHDQSRLPSTSTCVNLLKLPIYENVETLKDRLLYSINAGAGFNLS